MATFVRGKEPKNRGNLFTSGMYRHTRIKVLAILAAVLGALSASAQVRDPVRQDDMASARLLKARSKQRSGDNNAARAILLEGLSEAPNSASLLDVLGSVQQDLGNYVEAERSYLRALTLSAKIAGDPEQISVLQNLGTLYLDTHQYLKGQRIREQLENLSLEVLDDHPAEAAKLLNIIGSLEHVRNRDDEAERYYSRSLSLCRQVHGPASVDAALVEANLGFLLLERRQYDAAAFLFRQAIAEIENVSGVQDPSLIRPLINLATCERMRHRANEAEVLARRAVELSASTFGEAHAQTASAMLELAETMRLLGRKELAREIERQAKGYLRRNSAINLATFTVNVDDLKGAARR